MKLVFKGIVQDVENECRVFYGKEGSIYIGNRDVVMEIYETVFRKKVIIGVADEEFTGEHFVNTGWGYSEYTPMDEDELTVGKHDLLEILRRYEGQNITLFVSDEPINILDTVDKFCEIINEAFAYPFMSMVDIRNVTVINDVVGARKSVGRGEIIFDTREIQGDRHECN